MPSFNLSDWLDPDILHGRQPNSPVRINLSNPLTQGLRIVDVGSFPFFYAPIGMQRVVSDNSTKAVTPEGLVSQGTSAKRFSNFDLAVTQELTLFSICRITDVKANNCYALTKASGSTGTIGIGINGSTTNSLMYRMSGNTTSYTFSPVVSDEEVFNFRNMTITAQADGTVKSFRAGSLLDVGTISGGLVTRTDLDFYTCGAKSNGAPIPASLDLLLALVWDRALTEAEVFEISTAPWQIFAAENSVPFFLAGSSAQLVTASGSQQANTLSTSLVMQTHAVTAPSSAQANTASPASVSQTHLAIASSLVQSNTASSGAVEQAHVVTAATASQANQSSAGSVSQDGTTFVSATNSVQVNQCGAGAIQQTHLIICAPAAVDNIASSSSIVQGHLVAASNCNQANRASASGAGHFVQANRTSFARTVIVISRINVVDVRTGSRSIIASQHR